MLTFNPFVPSGFFYTHSLNWSISIYIRDIWLVFINTIFYQNSCFLANSVDPDQMLYSVVSDLGLHCLLMSL